MFRTLAFALMISAGIGVAGTAAAQDSATASSEAASMAPRYRMDTSLGTFVLELDAEKAPATVLNFDEYVKSGFYKGTTFHRIVPDFMIQGGGFTADYKEKADGKRAGVRNEWRNGLKNVRGSIAMARLGGQPDSATAQFFINTVDNASLDRPADGAAYAVFGKVAEGMDVVDKIRMVETGRNPRLASYGTAVPKEPVLINDVAVVAPLDVDATRKHLETVEKETAEKEAAELAAKAAARRTEHAELITKLETQTNAKAQFTDSGMIYFHEKEGTGRSPKASDTVEVHYRGTLLNGTEFDSSYKRNSTTTFPLGGVIKGWTEGLQLMKEGGKTVFVIPAELAYGARATSGIPANSTLVFEVELVAVK